MPTISATTRRARDFKTCANCCKVIAPRMVYIRAFGYAQEGDKPYAIALHVECADARTREKARVTVSDSNKGGA